jgi:hypothetical protein
MKGKGKTRKDNISNPTPLASPFSIKRRNSGSCLRFALARLCEGERSIFWLSQAFYIGGLAHIWVQRSRLYDLRIGHGSARRRSSPFGLRVSHAFRIGFRGLDGPGWSPRRRRPSRTHMFGVFFFASSLLLSICLYILPQFPPGHAPWLMNNDEMITMTQAPYAEL